MRNTTLCYIEKDDKYLMLLRNKKKVDENKGKWIGVGGKFEEGETPEECLVREVREETGVELSSYKYHGLVTFVSDEWGTEYMFLYTATIDENVSDVDTENIQCSEGELRWIPKKDIFNLNLWEGDKLFLELMINSDRLFNMKLVYKGDELVDSSIEYI